MREDIQIVTERATKSARFDGYDKVEAAGFERNGDKCGGNHLREELRGKPMLKGLIGPMWGGFNASGEPIIRYEDQDSYDLLSR